MANEEHLAILRQGAEAWNMWRLEHPNIQPNLRKANLSEADLFEANLREAELVEANLSRADLMATDLSRADLSKADLNGADLSLADLSRAGLTQANLTQANLSGAHLSGADLSRANLTQTHLIAARLIAANLGHATLAKTIFAAIDLSMVIGLDTVRHREPSTIGIDTLYLSYGQIPEVFLRGCGVPDAVIKNLPLLLGTTQTDAPIATIFTLNPEEIVQQQTLLTAHRRTLASQLHSWALLGKAHAPPGLKNGIDEARVEIARVKGILRASGVSVADHPDDMADH